MSGLPAWKRALLEKKKQQEQQEEIKKQKEQEAYIKSLPPWKRAIVMRDLEKAKSDGSPGGNAPTTPQSAGQDKWKAALSQANKLAASPGRSRVTWGSEQTKAASSTPSNKPPWARTPSPTTKAPSQIVGSPKATPNNKLSLMRTPSPTHPKPATITPSPSTTDTPSPREGRRGSVQSLADEFQKVSSPSSPPQSPTNTVKQRAKNVVTPAQAAKKATAQPAKQVVVQEQAASTPTATVQIDDSDLAGLPSWKRALIIKKRLKQAGLSELPVQKSDNKSTTAADEDKTDPSQPLSSKANPAPSALSAGKSRPNVVNRSDGESSGPNKLLQKEGVTLHAPIFNEVDQWANVAKDDPKFTQLPPWKQAMILRRRKDIAKRSGQETSPPDSPTVQHASENRKSSTSGGSQLENKKIGTKSPTKTSGKAEGKKTTTKAKTKAEEKKPATKTTNRSKTSAEEEKTTKKPVKSTSKTKSSSSGGRLGSTGSGSGSSSGLKPVRAAPTKPPSKETPPKEDKREAKKAEDKKAEDKGDEDKKEPMFTWNFSKHSVETGDAMSNSSDSELEDVQITSIDDELSDEDDSGIGGSGGTILTSYKPLGETENEKEKEKGALKSPLSTSTSDPEIMSSGMTRSESKSILVDTSKKSYKSLRRVSFSDSNLHTEHFYPKYDYSDYEDIEQELPDIFGRGKLRNAGLAHRLHPSLREDNDTDSDSYRYGFNPGAGSNSSTPSPTATDSSSSTGVGGGNEGGFSNYKPSILASFDSFNAPGFTGSPIINSPIKEAESDETSTDTEQVDGNSMDYYSSLNADTAALLW